MSLLRELATEPDPGTDSEQMPTLGQETDTSDVDKVPANAATSGASAAGVEKDSFEVNCSSERMSDKVLGSESCVKQPACTTANPDRGTFPQSASSGETSLVPAARSDVLEKAPVSLPLVSPTTLSGGVAVAEPSGSVVNSGAEPEAVPLQTLSHCSDGSLETQDAAGDCIVAAEMKDVDGNPMSLPSAPNDGIAGAASSSAAEKSDGREGPPLLQVESPPPLIEETQTVQAKPSVATTRKKPGITGVTRLTKAPPVLQPEVITLDDDEPVCDFEEPPLLLPEVAVTRKRKGIVRKRSFFGDTVDSGILKESILEGSPSKRANKSGMSVTQPKLTVQNASPGLKDDGVTVLTARSGKSGGYLISPKPKTPSKSGGDSVPGDRKRPEAPSTRPRVLNRQPLEKKASHIVFSVEDKNASKIQQRMTVVTRDKPLARRMGSGRQPCRRSGAARCKTSSVQGRFADTVTDQRITTGWRSVPPVPLGDVSTQCGYAAISERNREVYAPVSPPPGEMVALPHNRELPENMEKVVDGDGVDPDGVFMSAALEEFLEEKAPLKLSFPVPDCHMPHEKLADEDAEYPPPARPMPTVVRPQGEPRFKTLLEKQVWLGIRDPKELKAARLTPSPSKDASSSDALPLYSLLLPPRYLTPVRSSRDLTVHRGRHLLPLCKVMHKSLDMRRAWDEPAKGADCVQFIYDRHHQVRIRGSGSLSDGPTTRAYGKLVRPEAVEAKLNAWLQNDFRVTTEAVSRQRAMLVAASVQAEASTPVSGKISARQQTSRTPSSESRPSRPSLPAVRHSSRAPKPKRRLLLEDYITDSKTFSNSIGQATPTVEVQEDCISLEPEEPSNSGPKDSTADQGESAVADEQGADKQGSAADEQGSAADEQGSAADEQGSAADEQGSAADKQDSAADEQDSAADKQGPAADEQGPAADKQDPAADKQDSAADEKGSVVDQMDCSVVDRPADEVEQAADMDLSGDAVPLKHNDAVDETGNEEDPIGGNARERFPDLGEDVVNRMEGEDVVEDVINQMGGEDVTEDIIEEGAVNQMEGEGVMEAAAGGIVNQMEGKDEMMEDVGDTSDEDFVSDQEEQEQSSSEDETVSDGQEGDVAELQEGTTADQKEKADVRQENGVSEGQKAVLNQPEDDVASPHQDGGVANHENIGAEEGYNPDQQMKKLSDQEVDALSNEQTGATADQTHSLKHSVNELTRLKEVAECGNAMETDASCESPRPVCEPALQRSNSSEAEVQACLGPDTLEDFSGVVDVDMDHENAVRKAESEEEEVGSKSSQKVDTSDKSLSVDQTSEVAVTNTSRKQSAGAEPAAHLSFFKSLLENGSHLRSIRTLTPGQSKDTKMGSSAEIGKCVEEVEPDQPVVKTEDVIEAVETKASVTLPMKPTEAGEMIEHIKSEDQIQDSACEKSSSEVSKIQEETALPDGHTHNIDDTMDTKDDVKTSPKTMENQTATVTESEPKSEAPSVKPSIDPTTNRRACIHLPRLHLTAVRPYCMFHEAYDCEEYHPGGSCYMAPSRSRILQLQRNLAIRTGRLPPLPARHQHTARTFGRVRRKMVRPNLVTDSCVALLPVPDGTPMPPSRASPAPHRFPLPENVRISQVCEVVLLTPARSEDGPSCHGVRLHCGGLVQVGPGSIRAGVSWHMQPADNVVVTSAGGLCFRNPPDRDCTAPVDIEGPEGEVVHFTLAEVNRSLALGRMAVISGSEGGLTLTTPRMRVMCRDRLRRVAIGQKGGRELFGTGSVVGMHTAGQFAVLGALPPETTPEGGAGSDSKKQDTFQPVGDAPSGGSEHSANPSSKNVDDDDDELQVIGTVQGGAKERQVTTGTKRVADGDANLSGKKRQRARSVPKNNDEASLRKAAQASSQPRSSDGKFLPAAKKVTKTSDSSARTKNTKKTSGEAKTVVVIPAKSDSNLSAVTSPTTGTELPTLSPSWVMNRLHSVTVEVLQPNDEPAVPKLSPKSTSSKAPVLSPKRQQTSSVDRHPKSLTATGLLMSVVQKIAKDSTKPVKSPVVVEKLSSGKTLASSQQVSQNNGCELPKLAQPESPPVTNGMGTRNLKLVTKRPTPAVPPSAESAPKSESKTLLKRSFIAESAAVPVTPASGARSPRSRMGQRPGQSPRRKRPGAPQVSDETRLRVSDPTRPKVRRKSWADLTSRRSWTIEPDAAESTGEPVVPRRSSWDNPAARRSWMDPQSDRPRVRRKSDNPQDGARRRLGSSQTTSQTVPRPLSGEPQPTRPNSANPTRPTPTNQTCTEPTNPARRREEPAARLSPTGSRPPPTLIRCDGVPVRRGCDGSVEAVPVTPQPVPTSPEPEPAAPEPEPAATEPVPTAPEPVPTAPEPVPTAPAPVPAVPEPAFVDLTTPEKAPRSPVEKAPPAPVEKARTPSAARRRLKLPLEVTLLNESDMSDDGLDDLEELEAAVPAGGWCVSVGGGEAVSKVSGTRLGRARPLSRHTPVPWTRASLRSLGI